MSIADKPAFPEITEATDGRTGDKSLCYGTGLTKRELACIELRIPESGDEELDALIRMARRQEMATRAMQGIMAAGMGTGPVDSSGTAPVRFENVAAISDNLTDALIERLEKL